MEEFHIEQFFHLYVKNSGAVEQPLVRDAASIHRCVVEYLSFCRLGPRDCRILYEGEAGYVSISERGMKQIQNFTLMKQYGQAAITVQRVYRRFAARKRIRLLVDAVRSHRFTSPSSSDSSEVSPSTSANDRKILRRHLRQLSKVYQGIASVWLGLISRKQ